ARLSISPSPMQTGCSRLPIPIFSLTIWGRRIQASLISDCLFSWDATFLWPLKGKVLPQAQVPTPLTSCNQGEQENDREDRQIPVRLFVDRGDRGCFVQLRRQSACTGQRSAAETWYRYSEGRCHRAGQGRERACDRARQAR